MENEPLISAWNKVSVPFFLDDGTLRSLSYDFVGRAFSVHVDPFSSNSPSTMLELSDVFRCRIWSTTVGHIILEENEIHILSIEEENLSDAPWFNTETTLMSDFEMVGTDHFLAKAHIDIGKYLHLKLITSQITVECMAIGAMTCAAH